MYDFMQNLEFILVTSGIILFVFMIIRQFVLWYWKIDKIEENQKKIIQIQQAIFQQLGGEIDAEGNYNVK